MILQLPILAMEMHTAPIFICFINPKNFAISKKQKHPYGMLSNWGGRGHGGGGVVKWRA